MSARGLRGLLIPLIVGVTLLDLTGAPLAAAGDTPVVPAGRLAGLRYHVVAPGESIKAVAKRYGITVDALRAANGMTVETWYAGARVLIDAPNPANRYPGPTPPSSGGTAAAPAAQAPATSSYTVKSGDGFARIAKRTGTTVAALVAANGLTVESVIQPGQTLVVPSAAGPVAPAPAAPPTTTYTVKSGDSFARIAKRTGTTVAALVAANGTTVDATIMPGQTLAVPAAATVPAGSAPTAAAAAAPAAAGLVCPVPGAKFTYDWGFPRSDGRFHEGLDMFAPAGTPVLAPVSGTVTFTSDSLAGNAAVLNGTDTWHYFAGHLSKFGKKGQVKAGDVIGYVGASGNADGTSPHLHLEMRPQDGRPTNPWRYLRTVC